MYMLMEGDGIKCGVERWKTGGWGGFVCGGVFEWLTTKPTPGMYIYTSE